MTRQYRYHDTVTGDERIGRGKTYIKGESFREIVLRTIAETDEERVVKELMEAAQFGFWKQNENTEETKRRREIYPDYRPENEWVKVDRRTARMVKEVGEKKLRELLIRRLTLPQ